MNKTIFYSWESDLPNNTNRSFIQTALEKAIGELKKEELHLEIAIDRDIINSTGSPDIVNTLFEKIKRCHVFVADISFINKEGRLAPNPNVLLELGYAARSIGWENIICVFNKTYGKPEQLPFDLRFRSPLQYAVTKEDPKAQERNALANSLKTALKAILDKQHSKDVIFNNIKLKVDHNLMSIANNSYKLFYGYKDFVTPEDLFGLLELSDDELEKLIRSKNFLGFQLFKDSYVLQKSFQDVIDNPIFARHIDDEKVASLITLIEALRLFNENVKNRKDLFKPTGETEKGYQIIDGHLLDPDNPNNSFILAKILDEENSAVRDSGQFPRHREPELLKYFTVPEDQSFIMMLLYKDVFQAIDQVIENWGGSIMLNPAWVE